MNLAIRGISANLERWASKYIYNINNKDLKADFMANPILTVVYGEQLMS